MVPAAWRKKLVTFSYKDFQFKFIKGWDAPGYGSKVACKQLRVQRKLTIQPIAISNHSI